MEKLTNYHFKENIKGEHYLWFELAASCWRAW